MSADRTTDESGQMVGALTRAWEILVERAREGKTISYGEMATAMVLSPQSGQFTDALNEIARSEEEAGRGLLSVLVVRKRQGTPGAGFFDFAREMGRKFENEKVFFLEESERVIAHWQGRAVDEMDLLQEDVVAELQRLYEAEVSGETNVQPTARASSSGPLRAVARLAGRATGTVVRTVGRITRRGARSRS